MKTVLVSLLAIFLLFSLAQATKVCPNCGQEYPDDYKFCDQCIDNGKGVVLFDKYCIPIESCKIKCEPINGSNYYDTYLYIDEELYGKISSRDYAEGKSGDTMILLKNRCSMKAKIFIKKVVNDRTGKMKYMIRAEAFVLYPGWILFFNDDLKSDLVKYAKYEIINGTDYDQ